MAQFIPSLDIISKFKVKPEPGEMAMLLFLQKILDDSYEVYFNPYMNGDRPDIVIMKKGCGVLIIEVKDWNIDAYTLDDKKHWIVSDTKVKSPIQQVFKYKENLFDLHVKDLLNAKVENIKKFNIVNCAVYFHNASEEAIKKKLLYDFPDDYNYLTWMRYNIELFGNDSLTSQKFMPIFIDRYMTDKKKSVFFTDEIYNNFKRVLAPSVHLMQQGIPIHYNDRQTNILLAGSKTMRIKGLFGSGKTITLAAKAVDIWKRIHVSNPRPRILILTFNITLRNYILDKLKDVYDNFNLADFTIINYHQFINAELNNLNIVFEKLEENLPEEKVNEILEKLYYSNYKLFEEHKNRIVPYDAVLIDEVQDYRKPWMNIVKDFYVASDGYYYLFGDVKQNIYALPTLGKDVDTNVLGRPREIKPSYRSGYKVLSFAIDFQNLFFSLKYDIDLDELNIRNSQEPTLFDGQNLNVGNLDYTYIPSANAIPELYSTIRKYMKEDNPDINPNDITILGCYIDTLQKLDVFYSYYVCSRKTNQASLSVLRF